MERSITIGFIQLTCAVYPCTFLCTTKYRASVCAVVARCVRDMCAKRERFKVNPSVCLADGFPISASDCQVATTLYVTGEHLALVQRLQTTS